MKAPTQRIRRFFRRQDGATMIEYGLLAGIVSIAAVAVLRVLGPTLLALFQTVAAAVAGA